MIERQRRRDGFKQDTVFKKLRKIRFHDIVNPIRKYSPMEMYLHKHTEVNDLRNIICLTESEVNV